jgi:SAM-dependent methyltransferase
MKWHRLAGKPRTESTGGDRGLLLAGNLPPPLRLPAGSAVRGRELLAHAEGDVLEIGFGTGLNLPHYPTEVRRITTVDPNVGMHRLAQKRVRRSGIEVDHRLLSVEGPPFEDGSFDCVVSTFTLCSIERWTEPWSRCVESSSLAAGSCSWSMASAPSRKSGRGSVG